MSASAAPVLPAPGRPPAALRSRSHPRETPMHRTMPSSSRLHQEALQFRVILAALYPFFLAAAIAQRVSRERAHPRLGARRSVFAEARAMAVSAIPFAFMG